MGQKFKEDKIGALSHSLGVITLAASRLTIGGQQYSTSQLQLTLSGLTAHSTYMLYVVLSSGVPTLVSSVNVNSVGPAGFASWKLVGAFMANETPAWGAFLNIEGRPTTQSSFRYTPSNASGFGTLNSPEMNIYRDGAYLLCDYRFTTGTVSGATAFLSLPTNLVYNTSDLQQTTYNVGTVTNNSAVNFVHMFLASSNADRIFFNTATGALGSAMAGNTSPFASGQIESGQYRVRISGWSNVPLKDL